MKYLIDTDISSYFLRGKHNLLEIFQQKGFHNLSISRVSIAELEVLAYRNPSSKINLSAILSFSQSLGVLELDRETWRYFSITKAETLSAGTRRGDLDILNAAVAKQHNMILVTNNVSHYEDLVEVENWVTT